MLPFECAVLVELPLSSESAQSSSLSFELKPSSLVMHLFLIVVVIALVDLSIRVKVTTSHTLDCR